MATRGWGTSKEKEKPASAPRGSTPEKSESAPKSSGFKDPNVKGDGIGPNTSRTVLKAYQDVLGRLPTKAEIEEWGNKASYDQVTRHISTTREARSSGVDPKKFGVASVDPASLRGKEKSFYDVWRAQHPGEDFTNNTLDILRWSDDAMNITAFDAQQRGLIYDETREMEDGSKVKVRVVTPQAVDFAGGAEKLRFEGNKAGMLLQAPVGVKLSNFQKGQFDEASGYAIFGATGNPREAVLGSFGKDLANWTPDELKLAMDPLGLAGSSIIDKDWSKDGAQPVAKVTGLKEKDIYAAQDIGRMGVEAALTATGVGTGIAVAMEFAAAANKATRDNTSLSAAFEDAAYSSAGLVIGGALAPGAEATGWKATAQTAAGQGLTSGALTGVRTGDWGEAGKTAAWSAGGSVIGSGVSGGTGSLIGKKTPPMLTRTLAGAAGSTAVQGARYELDSDFAKQVDMSGGKRDLLTRSAATGAAFGASSRSTEVPTLESTFGIEGSKFTLSPMASGDSKFWAVRGEQAKLNLQKAGQSLGTVYRPLTWAGGKVIDVADWTKSRFNTPPK